MKPNILILSILFITVNSCNSRNELSSEDVKSTAHKYNRQFYTNHLDSLHIYFYDKSFTLQDLKDFRLKVDTILGNELEVIDEVFENKIWKNKLYYGYVRHSKFSRVDRPVRTVFAFDKDKIIYRFEVVTIPFEAPSKYKDYIIKTDIRFPFEGEWYVAVGGRSSIHNHHTVAADQRFAIDFLIKKNGSYFENRGTKNEDYFCFSKKVIAPGTGVVVDVVNDITENKIGTEPPMISGNRVIINHLNGEYSILCHFKKGTIVVNPGDTIKSGQFLGLCGNSGHSYAPHIHFHMQNSQVMFEGEGFPILFKNYYSNSIFVEEGEVEWGEYVRN